MSLRSLGWLTGLPVLAGLGLATVPWIEPGLDRDLTAPAEAVATATSGEAGEPWLRIERRGRDLVALGDAPTPAERDAALDRLADLSGPRRIIDRVGVIGEQSPFVWSAARRDDDRIDLLGYRPAETRRSVLTERFGAILPEGVTLRDHARAARGAPAGFAEAADFLLRQVVRLGPGATASLRDRTLTLQGEAASVDAYEAVRADLARPPAGFVLGDGAPEPATVKPFTWAAARAPDGSIRLSGHTVSEAERAAIVGAARALANGAPVEDAMRTARGLPAGVDARALTERAFAALALVRDGSVALEGSALSVRGAAIDAQAVQEADALTTGSLPDGVTRGSVDLTASPVSPYVVGIRRAGETVTLTGHLPDPASRAALLAALRPHFFGERILDRTRLAEGAPPDLVRALQAAAAPLGQLAAGEVTATDQVLRIAGESLYPESARRLSGTADRLAPPGWRAEIAVKARDAPALLDDAACRTAFDARLATPTVRFAPGSADLQPDFYPLLDDLAALARSCPDERVEVAGHVDPPGTAPPPVPKPPAPAAPKGKAANAKKPDPKAAEKAGEEKAAEAAMPDVGLPQRRAAAIVDYLLKAGVPAQRVGPGPAETMAERRAVAFALSRAR